MANTAKYGEWLEPDGLLRLQDWARQGLTDEQIAEKMGVGYSTLRVWKKQFPQIAETLRQSKDVVDAEVENSLLRKALDGDVTACIFWLKNRRPQAWREKRETVLSNSIEDLSPLVELLK